ncbi:SpoIIE family protein phosphatase [Streptomyces zingiberis]|uniref:SpoIIE family protein phosphatase n=1 Tax=Streptomyces zingiberis TaxID=2053010 RepID=A0ABX1BVI3_9ACTN|nr:SpoIIE family protein phosphatase [Streptomyces zingiberis]NJQ01686.1 SpoIIE family protein phosphatase [Streptomyces zingiberis]
MAPAAQPGLLRLLPRLLRCAGPQEMVRVLTAAPDGEPAPLAAGRTHIYVRGRDGLEEYAARPTAAPGPRRSAAAVLAGGRGRRTGGPRAPVALLPLTADGRTFGVLAAGLRRRPEGGTSPDGSGLRLLAQACAIRLKGLALDSAEPLLRAVEATGAGAFAWDLMKSSVHWDERACALYGVTPEEFDGAEETFFSALHPDDLPVVQAAIAQVTESAVSTPGAAATSASPAGAPAGGGSAYRLDYRVVHPDGSHHPLLEHGTVLTGGDGRPACALGLVLRGPSDGAATAPSLSPDRSRDAFLLTLARSLAQAVTVRDVTRVMTDLTRPALGAEGVVIGVLEHEHLRVVAETPVAPESRPLQAPGLETMRHATERDQPLFLADISRPRGADRTGPPGLPSAGPVPPQAWVVLPLAGAERSTGACLITFAGPREFDAGERTFYTAVAALLGQSLERARRFDSEHRTSTGLQRAMLPRGLPELPFLGAHARYLPATGEMYVGGDWYDVLPLPDGTAALVIGDVQGHDAHASAVMGQLRVVLRTCADAGMSPGHVLARANRVLGDLDTGLFATCVYLVLDPVDGSLVGARAGHPHPLLLSSRAAVELRLTGGPPLGVVPHAGYPVTRARLDPGETLLLFTDGLVERKGSDIGDRVTQTLTDLREWLRSAEERLGVPADLADLADFLLREDGDAGRPDDVALLAVRRVDR